MSYIEKNKWPLAIFATAFLIRLFYLIEISLKNPAFYYPMVDELWHLNWVKDIVGGSFWGDDLFFRAPLYPYVLALFYKIGGESLFFVRTMQALISSGSALLVFLIGKELFNKKIGMTAGFIYALYGTLMLYEAMLLIPVLFVFLNLCGIYYLIRIRASIDLKKWLLAGLIIGFATIARPNILLLVPLFMIWIYWQFHNIQNLKKRLVIPVIYLIGILIPVLAVTARNVIVTGEYVLISTQGGVNFYIGNNPETEGLTMLMPEIDLNESLPWSEFGEATRKAAEEEVGHSLTAPEESSFWTGKALDFILNNPGTFIEITFKKCVYFISGFENSDQTDIYQARDYSILYSLLLWDKGIYMPFGLLLPLAVAGIILSWKDRKKLLLIYLFVLGYIPTVVLFLVTARHRLPIVPFLIIFAAVAIVYGYKYIKRKDYQKFLIPGLALLVVLIISNRAYFDSGFGHDFQTHWNLALTYTRQGDLPKAEAEYKTAIEINPNSATTWNNLGHVQYRLGRMNDAMQSYNRAIEIEPKYSDGYNNIGLIHESQRNFEQAIYYYNKALEFNPLLYQAHLNLGDIHIEKNLMAEAEKEYLLADEKSPATKEIKYKLAGLYARMQKYDEAERLYLEGAKLGNPSAIDLLNWGNIYYASNRPSEAVEKYHNAISNDQNLLRGYLNVAITFDRYKISEDSSIYYLDKALEINPDFSPALEMKKAILER